MITLSSGVTCGLTLRLKVALRKEMLVAPLLVACWYGISAPCSMIASTLSAVMTRGLEMILPLPSDCSAVISRFKKRVAAVLNKVSAKAPAALPAIAGAGRLTLYESGKPLSG